MDWVTDQCVQVLPDVVAPATRVLSSSNNFETRFQCSYISHHMVGGTEDNTKHKTVHIGEWTPVCGNLAQCNSANSLMVKLSDLQEDAIHRKFL